MGSFSEVIDCWPSAEELARDLRLSGVQVRQWRNRDSIPAAYWDEVCAAALLRSIKNITLETLSGLARSTRRKRAAA